MIYVAYFCFTSTLVIDLADMFNHWNAQGGGKHCKFTLVDLLNLVLKVCVMSCVTVTFSKLTGNNVFDVNTQYFFTQHSMNP